MSYKLHQLGEWMKSEIESDTISESRAASLWYGYDLLQQLKDGKVPNPSEPLGPPPGSPIGS